MRKNALQSLVFVFSVTVVVALVYRQAVFLPFIQDDFEVLRLIQANDTITALRTIFDYENHFFFRPLAQTYILILYKIFGPNPAPFHAVALAIHAINSWLIAVILRSILRDRIVSYCCALIYAAAIATHLDSLAWAVGICDLGGAFFFLLSLWLFLGAGQDRPDGSPSNLRTNLKFSGSVIAYFLGCLFKEAIIFLPVILFSYPLLSHPIKQLKKTILFYLPRTVPFLAIMAVIVLFKGAQGSPLSYPDTHPYALAAGSSAGNIMKYIVWMSQAILPFSNSRTMSLLLCLAAAVVIVTQGIRSKDRAMKRRLVFLFIWVIAGLLPVLFLPHHVYRYYSTYSLPAFIAILLIAAKELLKMSVLQNMKTDAVILAICAVAVISSTWQSHLIYREGNDRRPLADGTGGLIAKAETVKLVQGGLTQDMPVMPKNAVIVIGGIDLWAFNKSSGPQFWYNDDSINVYDLKNLKSDGNELYNENAVDSPVEVYTGTTEKKLFLDASKVFAYKVMDGKFVKISPEALPRHSDLMP